MSTQIVTRDSSQLTGEQLHRHWQSHIQQWQNSDLSQVDYCKQHQLVYHRFVYWLCKFRKAQACDGPVDSGFVRVAVVPAQSAHGLSITLAGGVRIEGVDHHTVALLPKVIEAL